MIRNQHDGRRGDPRRHRGRLCRGRSRLSRGAVGERGPANLVVLLRELSTDRAGVTDTDEREPAPGQGVTGRRPLAKGLHLAAEQCHGQLFDRGATSRRLSSQAADQVIRYVDSKRHEDQCMSGATGDVDPVGAAQLTTTQSIMSRINRASSIKGHPRPHT